MSDLTISYSGDTILKIVAALRVMKAHALDAGHAGQAHEVSNIITALMQSAPSLFGPVEGQK